MTLDLKNKQKYLSQLLYWKGFCSENIYALQDSVVVVMRPFQTMKSCLLLKKRCWWKINDTSKSNFPLWPDLFMSAIVSVGVASYSCLWCRNLAAGHDASLCVGTEILEAIKASFIFPTLSCTARPVAYR